VKPADTNQFGSRTPRGNHAGGGENLRPQSFADSFRFTKMKPGEKRDDMLSNKRVERALSEAEQSFKDCWMKLMTLRGREYGKSELLNSLFSFQPTLGIALYKLEVLYEAMCKEGRHLVRRRSELSPKWFDNRMHTLDVYKHTLEETVDVGKVLGDSFAWIFYKNERELLRKHQDLQPNPHPPTGVGGRGEIAFVRRFPTFGRYLVLAHSTTTFLRVGDISLVDPTDLKVAAIGELKTHVKGDTSMGIKVILVGPKPKLSLLPNAALNAEANVPQQGVALPARMLERLKRQIKRMQESFKPFDKDRLLPPTGMSMEDTHSRLTELFRRTSSQNWGNLKVDRGLLIVGAKLRGNSLFDRLTSKTGAINNRNLGRVAEGTREIVDMALQDNSIRFDWLPYPAHGRYSLLWATRPLFWWPIDSK